VNNDEPDTENPEPTPEPPPPIEASAAAPSATGLVADDEAAVVHDDPAPGTTEG
jgi:hypothetical protein